MINRISLNGCRYIVSEDIKEVEKYCETHEINKKWIRFKHDKYYLKLWGRYKNVKQKSN
jgi:hypothetical protein